MRADVLARASIQDRFRMYERGILTAQEVGKLADADRIALTAESHRTPKWETSRKRSLEKFDQGKRAHTNATIHAEIDFYTNFEERQLKTIRSDYQKAETRYLNLAQYTLSPGLWKEMVPGKWLTKAGDFVGEGAVYLTKSLSGSVKFAYEGIREGILQEAHRDIIGSVAGREVVARAYQEALKSGDQKKITEAARALRGAEMMFQRSALWVTRANQYFERGLIGTPGYVADRLLKGWLEYGPHVQTVTAALAERSEKLLGNRLLESVREVNPVRDAVSKGLQKEIIELAVKAKVPWYFESELAMEEHLDKAGLFGIQFRKGLTKALDWVVGAKAKEGFWEMINYGSRRRTLDQVLGVEDLLLNHEQTTFVKSDFEGNPIELKSQDYEKKGLFTTMLKTRKALSESQSRVEGAQPEQPEGIDALLKHSSLTTLQLAQERYLKGEMDQFRKRKQLDDFWARYAKTVALPALSLGVLHAQDVLRQASQTTIVQAQQWLSQLQPQLATVNRVLAEAQNPSTYNAPSADVPTLMQWATSMGQGQQQVLQAEIQMAGQAESSASQIGAWLVRNKINIEAAAVAISGIPVVNGTLGVVRGFFSRKTSLGAAKPTVT